MVYKTIMSKKQTSYIGKFMWMINGHFVEIVSENTKSVTLVNGTKVLRKNFNKQPRTDMIVELGEWI